jgi:hypothetical protein
MPVRFLKKSYRGQPSYHMTPKAEHIAVFCESNLERDFYVLLKFFKWVLSYEEQPFKVPYVNQDGIAGRWTPDTLATFQGDESIERWLYEVKFRKDLWENWTENKQKFRGALWHCRDHGIQRFKIVTEVEIRSGSKLKNAKFFIKNRKSEVDSGLVDYILGLLADCMTMETRPLLENLWNQGVEQNDACVALYHLIANHKVGLDFNAPFTYRTALWLLTEGLPDHPSYRYNPTFRSTGTK